MIDTNFGNMSFHWLRQCLLQPVPKL
jgi:hypothetical protein